VIFYFFSWNSMKTQEMGANLEFPPRALRPDTQKITQK
jgi:hypothetical protein